MLAPAAERTLVRSEAPLILERWDTELAAIGHPRPVQGAFLPGLEDVVDRVMTRGTFANVRIKNLMVPGVEGGVTVRQPGGERMPIYDAAMQYKQDGTPLIILAGQEYGAS